jgi:hypothetical protein
MPRRFSFRTPRNVGRAFRFVYAEEKGFEIVQNPKRRKGKLMARRTKSELEQCQEDIAEVKSILTDAYTPEASREDLVEAVGKAIEQLGDYEVEEEDENGDDENGDDENGDDED